MFPFFSRQNYRYSSLRPNPAPSSIAFPRTLLLALVALLSVASVSFYAGRYSARSPRAASSIPLSPTTYTFTYNRTFGSAPSPASDRAWEALFPEQGGFFKHPVLAPTRSAFAVFHQLHCLNGIRAGYWDLHAAATTGRTIVEADIPFMSSPPHIRHCIDLLRNALMCQPDTTIEVKDEAAGGVTGFGTEHKCQVWEDLLAWTGRWEGWAQDPRNGTGRSGHSGHGGLHVHGG